MKLYHGSNLEVRNPKIVSGLRALDFGAGFYLTSNEQQASKWAKAIARRRGKGNATLNTYEIDENKFDSLEVLKFATANGDWLDFVVNNRKESVFEPPYALVIGPMVDDQTLPVINAYTDGVYTKEEAVNRLLPQNLTNQHAFLTSRALELLKFKESALL